MAKQPGKGTNASGTAKAAIDEAKDQTRARDETAPEHNSATLAQGQPTKKSSAGDKVVVANKLPFPFRVREFHWHDVRYEQKNGDFKVVREAEPLPTSTILHGSATPKRGVPPYRIAHGFAFTEGVLRDNYEKWAKDNKDQPFINNKLVFCAPDMDRAMAMARENAGRVTNMEPFNPDGDKRMRKSSQDGVSPIETAEHQKF